MPSSVATWERKAESRPSACLVAGNTDLIVARAAVDGAVILGQEWYLRLGSAFSTDHCVHFSLGALCTIDAAARRATPCGTA
ncbi:MAG TPA: hypothetical protein VFA10_26735 [Ktedonobacteraceae bacterium]|nr:hypothetical protein [Ktedonobacteraceae bacterium]